MNTNWTITATGMIMNSVAAVFYYFFYFDFVEANTISTVIVFSLFYIYACYHQEVAIKRDHLRYYEMEAMREDLKRILTDMPKSILIYDSEQEKVLFANTEFCKLMRCDSHSIDYEEIT